MAPSSQNKQRMLAIISPAKTLDFETRARTKKHTVPDHLRDSKVLIDDLRDLSPGEIARLMGISENLAKENYARFGEWRVPFTPQTAKQAILAFKGDVYIGLEADALSERDLTFAQKHVRILSGLYGLLRPLDLIQPYRLEMGTRLTNRKGPDLYAFWGQKLTKALNCALEAQAKSPRQRVLINLASHEYFRAIDPSVVEARIITPTFKDLKNGRYMFLSFFAKRARGLMTQYLIKERIDSVKKLKAFDWAGYRFSEEHSRGDDWVFLRDKVDWDAR